MKNFVFILILFITNICFANTNESSNLEITTESTMLNQISIHKTNQTESSKTESPQINFDRFENYNRNAYRLNSTVDKYVLRPTAVGYVTYIPSPFRNAIANFYGNLRDFVTLGNDILQFNGKSSMATLMRISINSTFGIFGLVDISSSLGLIEQKNSFGNTFKYYGWTNSSYYVIPLLGPSTVRDAIGIIPDILFNPTWYLIQNQYISISLFALNSIDTRTKFLGLDQVLDASIDPYVTLRDTYLGSIGESVPQIKDSSAESIDDILDTSPNISIESGK